MPTSTFHNLPPEKQEQFIEAAFDEFLRHDYQHASVSQIVKRLGIGKGSAYRYFESKKDLYFHLKGLAEAKKMQYVMPVLQRMDMDFFDMYRLLYKEGLRFMAEWPRYSHFLYNLSQERNHDELGEMMRENKQRGMEAFIPQLKAQQEQGRIRQDIDVELIAFQIVQVGTGLSEYILMKYHEDVEAIIKGEQRTLKKLTDSEMDRLTNAFLDMLQFGVRPGNFEPKT